MPNFAKYLLAGEYFNNGSKKEKDNDNQGGHYQDEIVPFGDFTVWFYHGHAIAMHDRKTGELSLANSGYATVTTKTRLNSLPGVRIYQVKYQWKQNGEDFKSEDRKIEERIGRTQYQRIDGWRGFNRPYFAVAGSSDTGGWSDSPCPSDSVQGELEKVLRILKLGGVKAYMTYSTTSNIFCIKRWVCVKGTEYQKAKDILVTENARNYSYVHFE